MQNQTNEMHNYFLFFFFRKRTKLYKLNVICIWVCRSHCEHSSFFFYLWWLHYKHRILLSNATKEVYKFGRSWEWEVKWTIQTFSLFDFEYGESIWFINIISTFYVFRHSDKRIGIFFTICERLYFNIVIVSTFFQNMFSVFF